MVQAAPNHTYANPNLPGGDDFTNTIHSCHFERSEKSKVGNRFACDDFRFLTAFGMTWELVRNDKDNAE